MNDRRDVIIVGAGAAGILAAIRAAERNLDVVLLEKNRKPGAKILMSGGTRCNITQATGRKEIIKTFGEQGPFLRTALGQLGPDELIEIIEAEGVPTKVEQTGKVFPVSNKSVDVLNALLRRLDRTSCNLQVNSAVSHVKKEQDVFVVSTASAEFVARDVIITTGGLSYPGCGTCGDGYPWATKFGHKIVPPRPALVPLTTNEPWIANLQGITLPDARVSLVAASCDGEPILATRRGSLLFTHFGISGPATLDISRELKRPGQNGCDRILRCDLAPDLSADKLHKLLTRKQRGAKRVVSTIGELVPKRLAEHLCGVCSISKDLRHAELSRIQRKRLTNQLKRLAIPITGSLGFRKAEVTAGGVALDQVNPKTMGSQLVAGLFFAGEILDLDGPIGGYNFQAAFSTGWLAGSNVGKDQKR